MDNPRYVLKTNEAVLISQKQNGGITFLKVGVWLVVAVIVIGSLVFQDNLFSEMSWTTRCLLIAVAIGVAFVGSKKENIPSPIELQFYDDYLILYRPKRYYSKKVSRMEINKMMYADIKRCVYKSRSQRIQIYGNVSATWYNYDANGMISQTPSYNRTISDTLCYFSTRCVNDVDFKTEIEAHSPIKVVVENS